MTTDYTLASGQRMVVRTFYRTGLVVASMVSARGTATTMVESARPRGLTLGLWSRMIATIEIVRDRVGNLQSSVKQGG
jgi:hypothetical protein